MENSQFSGECATRQVVGRSLENDSLLPLTGRYKGTYTDIKFLPVFDASVVNGNGIITQELPSFLAFPTLFFTFLSNQSAQIRVRSVIQINTPMASQIVDLVGGLVFLFIGLTFVGFCWFAFLWSDNDLGLMVQNVTWSNQIPLGCFLGIPIACFFIAFRCFASGLGCRVQPRADGESRWFTAGRAFGKGIRKGQTMLTRKNVLWILFAFGAFFMLSRCGSTKTVTPTLTPVPKNSFRIIAGSGHTSFEEILKRFGQRNDVDIQITYKGSLDIMQLLETGKLDYDAIWDGDSLWTTMGDKQHLIKNRESIMRSPVIFGVKKPLAEKLGWTAGKEVGVQEILQGIEKENLRVMMTSATQSNSGASAYLGFLNAFANPQGALTADDVQKPDVQAAVKKLLGTIDRTSESSGFLRDLFPDVYDSFDAMFNYESHLMELNKKLVAKNLEPLYLVYPSPGLGIADFPLSYVDHGDAQKEKIFNDLQTYLLADSVQQEIAAKCRRVGKVGVDQVDPQCFVPAWGADVAHGTTPMRLPDTSVVRQALDLYQTMLRKPSFTVYALDFSGSMEGEGEKQLKQAMSILLDQEKAGTYLLQASPDDITMVIFFDNDIINSADPQNYVVKGNAPQALNSLLGKIQRQQTGGGTDIYLPAARALEYMKQEGIGERLPAVILMTDGNSNHGSIQYLKSAIASTGLENVPVYGITFGDADAKQLQTVADLTHGRVFDGTKDLIGAFRKAKGNN